MSTSAGPRNRPFKYGADDRRQFIVENSEVALVSINDTDGNPIFLGRARIGTSIDDARWQIRKITYDDSSSPIRVEWPQNSEGNASGNYEFVWNADTNLTITGISQANPAVVTVSSIGDLENGDQIVIQGVEGMTQVNFTGENIYTVAGIAGSTFQLQGVDSSAYTAYSANGTVTFGSVCNLTYS